MYYVMTTFVDVEEELHIFLTFVVDGVDIFTRRSAAKEFPYPFNVHTVHIRRIRRKNQQYALIVPSFIYFT
jgi:hypothetical protein